MIPTAEIQLMEHANNAQMDTTSTKMVSALNLIHSAELQTKEIVCHAMPVMV